MYDNLLMRMQMADMFNAEASNNWVVHGNKTRTGLPLLANDPHLGTNVRSNRCICNALQFIGSYTYIQ